MNSADGAGVAPDPVLSALEARVLGCLMEKEATTPDVYPLSLNALVNACNQRNNRSPVMAVGEPEVGAALDLLREKRLASLFSGAGARAVKYCHEFGRVWQVPRAAQALVCELLLRGPQTAAALRANAARLAPMPEPAALEELLAELAAWPGGGLVRRLGRQVGQKEARWATCLVAAGEGEGEVGAEGAGAPGGAAGAGGAPGAARPVVTVALRLPEEAEGRLAALEAAVAELRGEVAALRRALGG